MATPDELTARYKRLLKKYHPDLHGPDAPDVDFDELKTHYREALATLLNRQEEAPEAAPILANREAFLDEFRNLVARGFPVSRQAMAKNRAYALCVAHIAEYLAHRFDDREFFVVLDAQTRSLKRLDPGTLWYVFQIYWNIGDYRFTGFDYYRRIFLRHLEFIRPTLVEFELGVLLRFLEDVTRV